MNKDDRKLLGRLEAKVENVEDGIAYIRKDLALVLTAGLERGEKIAVLQKAFENHLEEHKRNLKYLTIFFSALLVVMTGIALLL